MKDSLFRFEEERISIEKSASILECGGRPGSQLSVANALIECLAAGQKVRSIPTSS
jgi:hypothetical protein